MRYFVQVGPDTLELDIERGPDGSHRVRATDGREVVATSLVHVGTTHSLSIAGHLIGVQASEGEVKLGLHRFSVRAESERDRASRRTTKTDSQGSKDIVAPMPGRIVRVTCSPGDVVSKGTSLVVIEAMKMQNELSAKADHVVRAVRVAPGDTVDRGTVLIELD